ncbi:hypothetical protein VTN96DRAFT_3299 [Rasamsonia emersonii]
MPAGRSDFGLSPSSPPVNGRYARALLLLLNSPPSCPGFCIVLSLADSTQRGQRGWLNSSACCKPQIAWLQQKTPCPQAKTASRSPPRLPPWSATFSEICYLVVPILEALFAGPHPMT